MFKISLLALGMLFFNNGLFIAPDMDKEFSSATISSEVQEDIQFMNTIISSKLKKAALLEKQAELLLELDTNSFEGKKLLEDAKLQRLMTLKYKAAIACKTR